jgi:cobalt/nickel transport system ATP-binding protein
VSTPALRVSGLSFSYPDGTKVLDSIELTIERRERVALLGPNGAGKTTFLLHLIGILGGGPGAIEVQGVALEPASLREIRRRVGLVFQDPDDQLFMPTVYEDVAFGPANFGVPAEDLEERVRQALAAVGMVGAEERAPHHLSGGERRRVALATVLACQPDLLVLDEPSSNLDPAGRRELAEVLAGLETTILLVTHDLPYALQICDRSLIMNRGQIVADGPTRQLLADEATMRANRLELPIGFNPS